MVHPATVDISAVAYQSPIHVSANIGSRDPWTVMCTIHVMYMYLAPYHSCMYCVCT